MIHQFLAIVQQPRPPGDRIAQSEMGHAGVFRLHHQIGTLSLEIVAVNLGKSAAAPQSYSQTDASLQ